MSTLLLLATAFAQDCTPSLSNLVAAPAPGAVDVAPDISPVVMFPGDPCRAPLRLELIDQEQGFPTFSGDVTSDQLSPWGLASTKVYDVLLYAGVADEPFTTWSFTTSEDTWAQDLAGPSNLSMDAWIEEQEDGTLLQIVRIDVEAPDRSERVVMVEADNRVLWAANPKYDSLSAEVSYQVGTKSTPYCATLTDFDEVGGTRSRETCVDQAPPVTRLDSGCSTGAHGRSWGLGLLRR